MASCRMRGVLRVARGFSTLGVAAQGSASSNISRVLINENGCFVAYFENFLSKVQQQELFETLKADLQWNIEEDDFGPQDRSSYYMADDHCTFKYVGLSLEPRPWLPEVEQIRNTANKLLAAPVVSDRLELDSDSRITACLINNYEAGGSFIPWHFDEVRAHGSAKIVMSVSLGGERQFEMQRQLLTSSASEERKGVDVGVEGGRRTVAIGSEKISLALAPGSALLMAGDTQAQWLHQLPASDDPDDLPHRISLTFRSIQPHFEDRMQEMRR